MKLLLSSLMILRKERFPMKGGIVPRKLWPDKSRMPVLWVPLVQMIPRQLQKWAESFHELKAPCGSLDIESLNLSRANFSVSFANALA